MEKQRCMFTGARITKIAEPVDVSKPAECRNYSLRCTLCPSFLCYPFSFSPSADLSPIFRPPSPLSRALSPRALCFWTPPTFCISPTQLRHSQPLCVNSCTYRQRIPTGKGILLATFTLHNAAPIFVSFYPVPFSRDHSFARTIMVSALLTLFLWLRGCV